MPDPTATNGSPSLVDLAHDSEAKRLAARAAHRAYQDALARLQQAVTDAMVVE